jgi:hypothetical protein
MMNAISLALRRSQLRSPSVPLICDRCYRFGFPLKRKNVKIVEEDEDEWRNGEEKKHKIQHPTAANKSSFPEGVPLSPFSCVCASSLIVLSILRKKNTVRNRCT